LLINFLVILFARPALPEPLSLIFVNQVSDESSPQCKFGRFSELYVAPHHPACPAYREGGARCPKGRFLSAIEFWFLRCCKVVATMNPAETLQFASA
jgi:hypothetical protein